MLRFGLLLFFALCVFPVQAQDDPPHPLLENAVMVSEHGLYYWTLSNLVWVDNDTLVFDIPPVDSTDTQTALRYELATRETYPISPSPFHLIPTPEEIAYFHIAALPDEPTGYQAYISPFASSGNLPFIYRSSLESFCGTECNGLHTMIGSYSPTALELSAFRTLPSTAQCGMRVAWARDNGAAVLASGLCYNCCAVLYRVERNGTQTHIGSYTAIDGGLYALSDDANRVLYSDLSEDFSTINLILWERETLTLGGFEGVRTTSTIISGNTEVYQAFSGANFVSGAPSQIVALHADGVILIDLDTNERTVINPDLNTSWVDAAFFSPDNRHVAVVVEDKLYVVPV